MHIHESHFKLLRLAIFRQLPIEQESAEVFKVRSESHPNHWHTVNSVKQSCCCPAFGYCNHLALALDRYMEREAGLTERGDYFELRRLDFGQLPLRPDLPRDDKRYMNACVEKAREQYWAPSVSVEREYVCTF